MQFLAAEQHSAIGLVFDVIQNSFLVPKSVQFRSRFSGVSGETFVCTTFFWYFQLYLVIGVSSFAFMYGVFLVSSSSTRGFPADVGLPNRRSMLRSSLIGRKQVGIFVFENFRN